MIIMFPLPLRLAPHYPIRRYIYQLLKGRVSTRPQKHAVKLHQNIVVQVVQRAVPLVRLQDRRVHLRLYALHLRRLRRHQKRQHLHQVAVHLQVPRVRAQVLQHQQHRLLEHALRDHVTPHQQRRQVVDRVDLHVAGGLMLSLGFKPTFWICRISWLMNRFWKTPCSPPSEQK